jgi:cell division protein FtsB
MHRITTVAQAVQALEKENSALRDEIATLRQQAILLEVQ